MAHFAKLNDNNVVVNIIKIDNSECGESNMSFPDTCIVGQAFIANKLKFDGVWKQTSYNNNFRGKYASIGDIYDLVNDVFVAPTSLGE